MVGKPFNFCDCEIKRIGIWWLETPQLIFSDCEIKRIGIWWLGSPQLIFVVVKLNALAFGGWEALN